MWRINRRVDEVAELVDAEDSLGCWIVACLSCEYIRHRLSGFSVLLTFWPLRASKNDQVKLHALLSTTVLDRPARIQKAREG